jgi:hypothetical protein
MAAFQCVRVETGGVINCRAIRPEARLLYPPKADSTARDRRLKQLSRR